LANKEKKKERTFMYKYFIVNQRTYVQLSTFSP